MMADGARLAAKFLIILICWNEWMRWRRQTARPPGAADVRVEAGGAGPHLGGLARSPGLHRGSAWLGRRTATAAGPPPRSSLSPRCAIL